MHVSRFVKVYSPTKVHFIFMSVFLQLSMRGTDLLKFVFLFLPFFSQVPDLTFPSCSSALIPQKL